MKMAYVPQLQKRGNMPTSKERDTFSKLSRRQQRGSLNVRKEQLIRALSVYHKNDKVKVLKEILEMADKAIKKP